MLNITKIIIAVAVGFLVSGPVLAQTPDGETPSMEGVCDSLFDASPGLYGLCVAYCEAQDLNDIDFGNPIAVEFSGAAVLTGAVVGLSLDLATNVTGGGIAIDGISILLAGDGRIRDTLYATANSLPDQAGSSFLPSSAFPCTGRGPPVPGPRSPLLILRA